MNTLGETAGGLPFVPGQLEEKPAYRCRVAQGTINIIIDHLMSMLSAQKDRKMMFLVTHHNAIFEFMKLFKRKEPVDKKPAYCWSAAVDLQIPKQTLQAFIQKRSTTLNDLYLRNQLFDQIVVADFQIIHS